MDKRCHKTRKSVVEIVPAKDCSRYAWMSRKVLQQAATKFFHAIFFRPSFLLQGTPGKILNRLVPLWALSVQNWARLAVITKSRHNMNFFSEFFHFFLLQDTPGKILNRLVPLWARPVRNWVSLMVITKTRHNMISFCLFSSPGNSE